LLAFGHEFKVLRLSIVGLLLSNLGAKGQSWAGSLPVDSASGKIVYRGSIAANEIETTVLHKPPTRILKTRKD
jgi:hypothetical protein